MLHDPLLDRGKGAYNALDQILQPKGDLAAQACLIIMGGPIGTELPLIRRLARGKCLVDLNLVKSCTPRRSVLVSQYMATGAQAPSVAAQAQRARYGESTPVCRRRKVDADHL